MQAQRAKASSSPEREERRKKRGRKGLKLYLLLGLSLFLGGVAAAVGFTVSEVNKTLEVVTQDPHQIPDVTPVNRSYEEKKPLSFVIVGLDTRKNIGMLNTDVLVAGVANPVDRRLTMVSLPRDTRVEMPGYPGYHKINEVFALGENIRFSAESKGQPVTENGMTLLKKTLEQMLGIPVEHYVQLDFEGFVAVIDSLGGVTVEVDRELVYELPQQGIYRTLKKGRQVVNGEQALGFVRHRLDRRGAAYHSSDFDRNRRQQQVIRAVADKAASIDGLGKLTSLLQTMEKHIRTDLSVEQIKGLAFDFGSISSEQLVVLDNGAVWKSPYSLWPRENMETVRAALRAEMGDKNIAGSRNLSDASVAEFAMPSSPAASPPTVIPALPVNPEPQQPPRPPQKAEQSDPPGETGPVPGAGEQPKNPEPHSPDLPPPDIIAPPVVAVPPDSAPPAGAGSPDNSRLPASGGSSVNGEPPASAPPVSNVPPDIPLPPPAGEAAGGNG